MRHQQERGPMQLEVAAATDVGHRRSHNEDAYFACEPWFVVADGMGGHEAGEVASAAVVDTFSQAPREDVTPAVVADVLDRAQAKVFGLATGRPRSAGTTVTGVALLQTLDRPHWLVFNVGDSRVYRLVGDALEQLTVDHSLVQEMVEEGRLTRDEARWSPHRNVITRALGAGEHQPDFFLLPVTPGERLVLCSDGLTSEVDDADVEHIVRTGRDPVRCVRDLLEAALDRGGRDNVTIVVVDVIGGDEGAADNTTGATRAPSPVPIDPVAATSGGATEVRP